jgi:2-dehydro-3-deoxygluconokinase
MIRNTESMLDRSSSDPALVTVGEALLRLASPTGLRLTDTPSLDVHVAGAEANVAVAAARLGTPARWVGALPDDVLGRRVAASLTAAGVATDAIAWDAAPGARLGLFFSDTGVAPRPAAVTYDRARSSFASLDRLPDGAFAGAARVHVTGITPAVAPPALTGAILAEARAAGAALSMDINYRARLWPPEQARAGMAPLLAAAETVVCGLADARAVFGLESDDAAAVAHALRERHAPAARRVVVTTGAEGCVAVTSDGAEHEQAGVPATVVDRFGMGDAFTAGLLWSLLDDADDIPRALRAAVHLAALKATVHGDLSQTTREELLQAMDGAVAGSVLR